LTNLITKDVNRIDYFLRTRIPNLAFSWYSKEERLLQEEIRKARIDSARLAIIDGKERVDGQLTMGDRFIIKEGMDHIIRLILPSYSNDRREEISGLLLNQTMSLNVLNFAKRNECVFGQFTFHTQSEFESLVKRVDDLERRIQVKILNKIVEIDVHKYGPDECMLEQSIYVNKGFISDRHTIAEMTFCALENLHLVDRSSYPQNIDIIDLLS